MHFEMGGRARSEPKGMDAITEEGSSRGFVDEEMKFGKSLKELRDLSSQLYHVANYCETAFCTSGNKTLIVKNTKDYVAQAVVTVVDHLGSISATIELAISKSNTIPETQSRIDCLKQRIGVCQQYSHKLALARFRWNVEFSRFHSHYIWSRLDGSATMSSAWRIPGSFIDALSEGGGETRAEKQHQVDQNPTEESNRVSRSASMSREYANLTMLVHDGPRALPRTEHSPKFQLEERERRKPLKQSLGKLKLAQKKDIAAALIRRGKRILA